MSSKQKEGVKMRLAKKLMVMGAPFALSALALAEGETTTTTYDVTTFWSSLNINFGELISQGAAILGVIMLAIVSVSLTFKVVMAGLGWAKKAFSTR